MKYLVLGLLLLTRVALADPTSTINLRPGQSGLFYDYNTQQEVQVRCGGNYPPPPPPPSSNAVLLITCDEYTNMIIEMYDRQGTKIADYKSFMGSNDTCTQEKTRIMTRTQNGHIAPNKTIAYCDEYTNMIKLKFAPTSITESEKVFTGSNDLCSSRADAFNNLF